MDQLVIFEIWKFGSRTSNFFKMGLVEGVPGLSGKSNCAHWIDLDEIYQMRPLRGSETLWLWRYGQFEVENRRKKTKNSADPRPDRAIFGHFQNLRVDFEGVPGRFRPSNLAQTRFLAEIS